MSFSSQQQQQQQRRRSQRSISAIFLFLAIAANIAVAFQPIATTVSSQGNNNNSKIRMLSRFSRSSLYAQQETTPPAAAAPRRAPRPGEFELQELKVNLDSMRKQNVASRDLQPMKRLELQGYAEKVTQSYTTTTIMDTSSSALSSPIPLNQLHQVLPGTKWRLQFSTQPIVGTDLPPDATITLTFHNDDNANKNVMDYSLEFSEKTFGLNAIKATSQYTVGRRRGEDNDDGLVTFVYDEIKTNAFGFQDIPTGFFGMLKGRVNYIQSVFMDDQIWIERGFSFLPDNGQQPYYNVYVREQEI